MTGEKKVVIALGNKDNLVLVTAKKGYVMCGLLSVSTAENLGHAACKVTGVRTAEDVYGAIITDVTTSAKAFGIEVGMTGAEAIKRLS